MASDLKFLMFMHRLTYGMKTFLDKYDLNKLNEGAR